MFSLDSLSQKLGTSSNLVSQSKSSEQPKTPNNSPENPDKEASAPENKEKLCWSRKTKKKMILSEQIYLSLENQILSAYGNMNINISLFNMQKIYHRCVFDSFNEIMTAFIRQERHYEMNERDRQINQLSVFSQFDVEYILAKTQSILIDYVQQQCGVLRDKEDSLLDSVLRTYDLIKYPLSLPLTYSISNIRKDRMNRSCNADLKEAPEKTCRWLDYKKEVVSRLADLVVEHLFEDSASFLLSSFS
jgi:hypothetical protein